MIGLRDAGRTYDEIASQTGLSRTGVFDICKRHGTAGPGALHDAPNSRKTGDGRALDPAEERMLRRLLADNTPDELSLPGLLWTPAGVAALIARRRGKALSRRTVAKYLTRWGYVLHRRARQPDGLAAQGLRRWLDQVHPAIEARARLEGAEIHWVHGAALQRDEDGMSPAGQQGTVVSTVTKQGHRHWMTLPGALDAPHCIDFLRRLAELRSGKLFLVVFAPLRLPADDAQVVSEWLAEHDERIEVFRLPRGRTAKPPSSATGAFPETLQQVEPHR
ncbi:MAG: winged helix-turn-helix domain-containing protein [Methylibium sp.]|nr:winged helix-turn-helix domain-containing protein [Methylibium sp.]MBA3588329.1 winged helix-turn-helix domain-containing protein [Methylibium sp.]